MSSQSMSSQSTTSQSTSSEAEETETAKPDGADTTDLENVLEGLQDAAAECSDQLSVGDALDAFAERSFGALLTLIGLVAALPVIGAIPGMSILTGTLVILIAGQYLLGHEHIWAPKRLRDLSISAETMEKGVEKAKPYAARIDALIKPRLTVLTQGPLARTAIALASIALAIMFYPMALVPFGVYAPALSVIALGMALMSRDGALALIGYVGALGSIALMAWLL